MIDDLYNVTRILENPREQGVIYRRYGLQKAYKALERDELRYADRAEWKKPLAEKRGKLDALVKTCGIDMSLLADWTTLGNYAKRLGPGGVRTPHQLFIETFTYGVPMLPELAEAFQLWRHETPYNQDNDWVFASPYTDGERPYYGESAMSDHILPAVRKTGCTKRVGWHTFRRSFACLMGDRKEDVKVVQELMRHSSSKLTLDIYQQGAVAAKRLALTHSAEIFSA